MIDIDSNAQILVTDICFELPVIENKKVASDADILASLNVFTK
jgi:hypothetical protein